MKKETSVVHAGRHPETWNGAVNPPVYRCSTVLAPSHEELRRRERNRFSEMTYGIHGTPTSRCLEEAIAAAEGGAQCVALESGLAAITAALLAFVSAGDHILVVDSVYGPTRAFCDNALRRLKIETTYYDPRIGAGIADLIRDNTVLIYAESPGSLTFEVQDIPAIAAVAHARGIPVLMDNTWGLLSFSPFEKDVDVSIQAATKYISGHSDAMLGAITTANATLYEKIRTAVALYGFCVGSEEASLGQRGIRTLSVRLKHQFAAGLEVAQWLERRPEVAAVLHPALPSHPDHALWKRDFDGGCGLFGVILKPEYSTPVAEAMIESYHHFAIGYSWGGYESLALCYGSGFHRQGALQRIDGTLLRYHIGLEAVEDLITDLERGFALLSSLTSPTSEAKPR